LNVQDAFQSAIQEMSQTTSDKSLTGTRDLDKATRMWSWAESVGGKPSGRVYGTVDLSSNFQKFNIHNYYIILCNLIIKFLKFNQNKELLS
jgi:hypothetical protein